MTKDVMISIRGLQFMEGEDGDDIETVQQGEYYEKNGADFLLYDEYLEGFPEPVKNVIRIRDREMTLTKRGILNVQMNFEVKDAHPVPDALRCDYDRAGYNPRGMYEGGTLHDRGGRLYA